MYNCIINYNDNLLAVRHNNKLKLSAYSPHLLIQAVSRILSYPDHILAKFLFERDNQWNGVRNGEMLVKFYRT